MNLFFGHLVRLLRMGDQPVAKATTYTGHHNTEERWHTNTQMPRAGFEPTIPVFERLKTRCLKL